MKTTTLDAPFIVLDDSLSFVFDFCPVLSSGFAFIGGNTGGEDTIGSSVPGSFEGAIFLVNEGVAWKVFVSLVFALDLDPPLSSTAEVRPDKIGFAVRGQHIRLMGKGSFSDSVFVPISGSIGMLDCLPAVLALQAFTSNMLG